VLSNIPRKMLILAALVLTVTPLSVARGAQTPPIVFKAQAGLDGFAKSGAWVPVQVDVSNDGPDLSAQMVVVERSVLPGGSTQFVRPVELPRQSHKKVFIYWAPSSATQVDVRLVAASTVLAEQTLRVTRLDSRQRLYGLFSSSPSSFNWLATIRAAGQNAWVAQLAVDDLPPQAEALASLDALIVHDADTGTLSSAQRDALRRWVERGGRLVVTGGPNWQRSTAGLADLLPVTVSGVQRMDALDALARAGSQALTGPVLIAASSLREGEARVAQDGVPLIAERQVGAGHVDYIAWDPATEPLASWAGNVAVWSSFLQAEGVRPPWNSGVKDNTAAIQALSALPGAALPPAWQICGFLLLYVVILGPVNYLALSKLRRREWAWITVPLISLVFGGCAYLTGFQARGPIVTLHRLLIVQGQAGQLEGRADALLGVFSPRRGSYDVQISPDASIKSGTLLAQPLRGSSPGGASGDFVVEQGDSLTLRRVRVDVGAMQPFALSLSAPLPRLSANLTLDMTSSSAQLSGEVRNDGDVDLTDVVLLVGNDSQQLGDLKSGQKSSIFRAPTGVSSQPGGPASTGLNYRILGTNNTFSDRALRRRGAMLDSVLGRGLPPQPMVGVYLAGWTARAPMQTLVNGAPAREQDQTLYLIQLPFQVNPSAGKITLPPGLMTWETLGSPGYTVSPYAAHVNPNQPVSFRFRPWPQLTPTRVTSATVHLEGSNVDVKLELYNLRTSQWDKLADLVTKGEFSPRDSQPYVGPDGAIDVRLTAKSSSGWIPRLDVTLEGER